MSKMYGRKWEVEHYTLVILVIIAVTILILSNLDRIFDTDPPLPVYKYDLEIIGGDYVITFYEDKEEGWSVLINYCKYEYYNASGSLVDEGDMTEIWEKNPEFMDEKFSNWTKDIYFIDYGWSTAINDGDQMVIRSVENGGIGEQNGTLKLLYWWQPYEEYLSITLRNDVPHSSGSLPLPLSADTPMFSYNSTYEWRNDSLHMVTDHLASDAFPHFPWTTCPIGLTLFNNSTVTQHNISISVYWEEDSHFNSTNYTRNVYEIELPGKEMIRFIWEFPIPPQYHWLNDPVIITAKIQSEDHPQPIIVRTKILISSVSHT